MRRLADPGRVAAAARDHARALRCEQPRRLESDARGRAGDEAAAVPETEIHRRASVVPVETTVLLARHGETDWNLERRVQGHIDTPLNETGWAQAESLADELAGEQLDAVYASDLARARETAGVVAARHGLPVVTVRELREKDFGTWEGLTDEDVFSRFPEARNGPWGDAETSEELAGRVLAALHDIAGRHPGGRVLVVTHGGPLRAVMRQCGSALNGPIANCHVVRVGVLGTVLRPVD